MRPTPADRSTTGGRRAVGGERAEGECDINRVAFAERRVQELQDPPRMRSVCGVERAGRRYGANARLALRGDGEVFGVRRVGEGVFERGRVGVWL